MRTSIILTIALAGILAFSGCKKKEGCNDPKALNFDERVAMNYKSMKFSPTPAEIGCCGHGQSHSHSCELKWRHYSYNIEYEINDIQLLC